MSRAAAATLLLALVAALVAAAVHAQTPSPAGPPYVLDPNWPQWATVPGGGAANVTMISAVAVDDARDEVHVGTRPTDAAADPVYVFRASTGVFVRSWGAGLITTLHGIRVQRAADSADGGTYVWVADTGDHTVKQFATPAGALLRTLGTRGRNGTGVDPVQFDHVADVAFGRDGRVYVSDGDGGQNHRVLCFVPPAYGNPVAWAFGAHAGTSNNDFASPHSVAIDALQRLWVADRDNNRTQLFGTTGGGPLYLATWHCFRGAQPWGVAVWQAKGWLFTADGQGATLLLSDAQSDRAADRCNVLWSGPVPHGSGGGGQVHLLDVDQSAGDVYVAVVGAAPNTFVRRFAWTGVQPIEQ